jgi:hypothetical protein
MGSYGCESSEESAAIVTSPTITVKKMLRQKSYSNICSTEDFNAAFPSSIPHLMSAPGDLTTPDTHMIENSATLDTPPLTDASTPPLSITSSDNSSKTPKDTSRRPSLKIVANTVNAVKELVNNNRRRNAKHALPAPLNGRVGDQYIQINQTRWMEYFCPAEKK